MITVRDSRGDVLIASSLDRQGRAIYSVVHKGLTQPCFFAPRRCDGEIWWLWSIRAEDFRVHPRDASYLKLAPYTEWQEIPNIAAMALRAAASAWR